MGLFFAGMFTTLFLGLGAVLIDASIGALKEKKEEEKERNRRDWTEWRSSLIARIDGVRRDLTNAERGVEILTARADGQLKYVDACMEKHEQYFHAPKKEPKKK